MTLRFRPLLAAATCLFTLLQAPSVHAQSTVTVVEYFNVKANAYFLTGRASEQATLDTIADFKRTGVTFTALPASAASGSYQPVCRYLIQVTPTFASHFYGLPADCQLIANAISSGAVTNFVSEGLDFAVEAPIAGSCPASSSTPVRRALRMGTPIEAPNHRYSVTSVNYQDMLVQGWTGENVVFCTPSATAATPLVSYASDLSRRNFCETPRSGVSPRTGQPYPDVPGTLADEKAWIRAHVDNTYLWYREVGNVSPNAGETVTSYFSKLKTPALAPAGGQKDRFSASTSTASIDNQNAGITFGYGVEWAAVRSTAPREWIAAVVDPGSPAAQAGVMRGDKILSIDGVDFINGNNTNALNRGLFPPVVGESHTFTLQPANGGAQKTAVLTSASLLLVSVPVSGVLNTPTGKVGYIAFTTFSSFTAEKAIGDAVAGLAPQGITDLVLDLRYNGGGYIYISSQLSYMIAGAARTSGKKFEEVRTNDKKPFGPDNFYPFYNVGSGFSGGLPSGQALPTLNLSRVFALTTGDSCSASESLINALRGIDVQVIQIGTTTCGKPYGFQGADNCGTTYFPIQFTGVNDKGQGDFISGFAPTCIVNDDLTKSLGDVNERQLSAALAYRATGTCPVGTASAQKSVVRAPIESNDFDGLALKRMKLVSPADARRDAGSPITPRAPRDLGDFGPNQMQQK
jgi:carboxyl-terminal processing protease